MLSHRGIFSSFFVPHPNLQAHISASRDLGLKTGIWASGQGFEGGGTEKKKKEKEEKKIPHMCESIGHQPLWGRLPKRLISGLEELI